MSQPRRKPAPAPLDSAAVSDMGMLRGYGAEFQSGLFIKSIRRRSEGDETSPELIEPFLESARLQQSLAEQGAAHWAPIHQIAVGSNGPYYVANQYARSAEALVQRPQQMTEATLHRMVSSVLQGLSEIKARAGRAHGNLKASNVLITTPGGAEPDGIDLADPAPAANAMGPAAEARDVHDLGRLIHLLVMRRPHVRGAGLVASSEPWSKLGPRANAWRALCNQLLGVDGQPTPSLAEVRESLTHLRPRQAWIARPAVALGVLAMVLAGGFAYQFITGLQQPPSQASGGVAPSTATTPAVHRPDFAPYISAFHARGWSAAADEARALEAKSQQAADTDAALAPLQEAQALCGRIEAMFARIDKRRAAIASAPDPMVHGYSQAVDRALAPAATAPAAGASALSALGAELERLDADAAWNAVADAAQAPASAQVDWPWFIQTSEAHHMLGAKSAPDAPDLAKWAQEVSSGAFARLDGASDPRAKWPAPGAATALRSRVDALKNLYTDEAAPAAIGRLAAEVEDLGRRINHVRDAKLEWTRQNADAIQREMGNINAAVAEAREALEHAITEREAVLAMRRNQSEQDAARRVEVEKFIAECRAAKLDAEAPVATEWSERNQKWADEVSRIPALLTPELAARRTRLRTALVAIDALAKALRPSLDIKQGAAPWNSAVAQALESEAAARRAKLLADALAQTRSAEDAALQAAQVDARWEPARVEYGKWAGDAVALVANFNHVEGLLAMGYAPGESPAPDDPSASQIAAKWADSPLLKDAALKSALSETLQAATPPKSDNAEALLAGAEGNSRLGAALAAWRGLGETAQGAWPAKADDMKRTLGVEAKLLAAADAAPVDAARKAALRKDVLASSRSQWERFLRAAAAPADIEYALDLAGHFEIADLSLVDPRAAFNSVVRDARKAMAGEGADVAAIAERLAAAAQKLPEKTRTGAEALIAEIARYKANPQQASLDAVGPAAPGAATQGFGWKSEYDAATGALRMTARPASSVGADEITLTFRRVEAPGAEPFFLSTTEVSLGLFQDAVAAAGKWPDMGRLLWNYDVRIGDSRSGPRVWEWPDGREGQFIKRSVVWLSGEFDQYPPELGTLENRSVLRDSAGRAALDLNPSRQQPMQQISVEAAEAFAKMMGCRIPTSAEWKSAVKNYGSEDPRWNLRDRTWKRQLDWITSANQLERHRPDAGMFVPAGEKPSDAVWTARRLAGDAAADAQDKVYDDGVLWFSEVAPNGNARFNHLVGNVGEFVRDGEKVFVIGGSALSPPERALDKPFEVDVKNAPRGYADVGLRLAFSAPMAPIARLRAMIEKQPYALAADR